MVEAVVGGKEPGLTEAWRAFRAEVATLPGKKLFEAVKKLVVRLVREQKEGLDRVIGEAGYPFSPVETHHATLPLTYEALYSEWLRRTSERAPT
jgi:hypothetical protein